MFNNISISEVSEIFKNKAKKCAIEQDTWTSDFLENENLFSIQHRKKSFFNHIAKYEDDIKSNLISTMMVRSETSPFLEFKISAFEKYITITSIISASVYVGLSNKKLNLNPCHNNKRTIIFYKDTNKFFYATKNSFTPLTLKILSDFLSHGGILFFSEQKYLFFEMFFQFAQKSNLFLKDIKQELISGRLYVPSKIDELMKNDIKNKKMFFEHFYKFDFTIPRNINKETLTCGYLKIMFLSKINPTEHQKIWDWQMNEKIIMEILSYSYKSRKCINLYFEYMKEKIKNIEWLNMVNEDKEQLLMDFCKMSYKIDKYFNINIKSFSKIKEKHDALIPYYISKTSSGKMRIPQKSPFRKLVLPLNFELIRTAKRLKEEGVIQQHCVFSYLSKVNDGECVIYSCVYDKNRYTFEVNKREDKDKK